MAANGFFVAAEFGLVRARQRAAGADARRGRKRGAALALKQLDQIDEYLSACQLGITMASLGIGFLGEPAIARLLEDPLGDVACHGVAVVISLSIAYLLTTSLHITFGEQVPKIYSISTPRARPAAPRARWTSSSASSAVHLAAQRGLQRDPAPHRGRPARPSSTRRSSSEDLKLLIAAGADGRQARPGRGGDALGRLPPARAGGAPGHDADPAVVTVDVSENVETALRRCVDSGHTRLVVTEDDNTTA